MTTAIHYTGILELSALLRDRQVSPVEVTEAMIARIEARDRHLKAYATTMFDEALAAARTAEREILDGHHRGHLHGVPVAVKDLCETRGVRTMGGLAVLADHIPDRDCTVVERLKAAGAVLLGKLNLTEGAMGGYNPALQVPQNPWRPDHWAGASSSGSGVAAAAGLAHATLGSDTGGSIRHPAAVCGTVGLKPTWGRVSRHGVLDLAQSLDHVGPLTRSAADAGIVLQAIAGVDDKDPTTLDAPVPDMLAGISKGVHGLRIGWDPVYGSEDLDADHAAAVSAGLAVMRDLGAEIVEVGMPTELRRYLEAWPLLCSAEAVDAHRPYYPARAAEYGPWFRQWLSQGSRHTAADYARAHMDRLACVEALRRVMRDIDLLAGPTTPRPAYPYSLAQAYGPIPADRDPWDTRFTVPMDYAGLPTIALPCGLNDDGLPLSLQFTGHALSEPLLIQAGAAFEDATGWHRLRPPE